MTSRHISGLDFSDTFPPLAANCISELRWRRTRRRQSVDGAQSRLSIDRPALLVCASPKILVFRKILFADYVMNVLNGYVNASCRRIGRWEGEVPPFRPIWACQKTRLLDWLGSFSEELINVCARRQPRSRFQRARDTIEHLSIIFSDSLDADDFWWQQFLFAGQSVQGWTVHLTWKRFVRCSQSARTPEKVFKTWLSAIKVASSSTHSTRCRLSPTLSH